MHDRVCILCYFNIYYLLRHRTKLQCLIIREPYLKRNIHLINRCEVDSFEERMTLQRFIIILTTRLASSQPHEGLHLEDPIDQVLSLVAERYIWREIKLTFQDHLEGEVIRTAREGDLTC